MDQMDFRKLMKEDLLNSIWTEIGKAVDQNSKLNQTEFSELITGNHSWYSAALNNSEDIQLSSLARVLGQLSSEISFKDKLPLESIFSEKNLQKARLLSYLTSTTEENKFYLPYLIKHNLDFFKKIQINLAPLYRNNRLSNEATRSYKELQNILQRIGSEQDD